MELETGYAEPAGDAPVGVWLFYRSRWNRLLRASLLIGPTQELQPFPSAKLIRAGADDIGSRMSER